MSVLTSEEQELFDFAKSALPKLLLFETTNPQEILAAYAKMFRQDQVQLSFWVRQTYIRDAVGFWLDQHAKDRGTRRRAGETDEALSTRLRVLEDLITEPALLSTVNEILAANGLPPGAIVELRKDRGFFTTFDATVHATQAVDILEGETFDVDDLVTPTTYEFDRDASVGGGNVAIDISAAVTAQDVAIAILAALAGAFTAQVNPKNDAEVKLKSTTVDRGILVTEAVTAPAFTVTSGRKHAYFSRGYRMGREINELIIILPFGTTADIGEAIREAARQKKGAGTVVYIEIRANP